MYQDNQDNHYERAEDLRNDLRESQTEREHEEQELRGEPTEYEERHYALYTALHHAPAQQIAEVLRETDPRIIHVIKEIITEL